MSNVARIMASRPRPFRVSIEGNIGSGKSTCIKFFDGFQNVEKHAVSDVYFPWVSCFIFQ